MMLRSKKLRLCLGLALLGTITWLGLALAVAHGLTRRARFVETLPVVTWSEASELDFVAKDGARVPAWFFDTAGQSGTVLVLHGRGGSRSGMVSVAQVWAQLGLDVLVPTLRAHGDAEGERNDMGWTARLDAMAAIRYCVDQGHGPVIVHGISMGSAAACLAALEMPPELWPHVAGIVLESPFINIAQATHNRTAWLLPPVLDRVASFGLELTAPLLIDDLERINPLGAFDQVPHSCPVLVLSGLKDERSPRHQTRMFEEVRHGTPGSLTLIERELGHTGWYFDTINGRGDYYQKDFTRWLALPDGPALALP